MVSFNQIAADPFGEKFGNIPSPERPDTSFGGGPGAIQNTYGRGSNDPFAMLGMVPSYAAGGAIDTEENPLMSSMGSRLQFDINSALSVVNDVLSYGRKLHGLGGGEDEGGVETAGIIPSIPFRETPTPRPMPGPLPPTSNPFGKRVSENEADDEPEGAIDTEETA